MATPYYTKFESDAKIDLKTKPYIKSNESLSLAKRKGDVLYGILDQYTGEEITLSKVTETPTVDNIIYFQLGSEYFKRNFDIINVKWFGAKGNGVIDDTVAIQNAINAKFPVFIPNGEHLITNSLGLYENSIIIGDYNSSNNFYKAKTKIVFTPSTKKDLFILNSVPTDYVYGVRISGVAIRGVLAGAVTNLPKMSNVLMEDIKVFGGFDYGVILDGYIDSNINRCSFQGFAIAPVKSIVSDFIGTTTSFYKCYFSQAPTGVDVNEHSINSLAFNHCIFESLNTLINLKQGNEVNFYGCYVENTPKIDSENTYAFIVGEGASESGITTLLWNGGKIAGYNGGLPVNSKLINSNFSNNISFSNVAISRYIALLNVTDNAKNINFSNIYTENVDFLGGNFKEENLFISGGNLSFLKKSILESEYLDSHLILPEIYFNDVNQEIISKNKLFKNKIDGRLKFKDNFGNIRNSAFLSAGSASATFNGGSLQKGELVLNNVNVLAGKPVGFVSAKYSKDTASNIYDAFTTAGSPVIDSASNIFFAFKVNDYVTLTNGMASTTDQYRIIAKSEDQSTITLDTNALTSETGVFVQIPTHELLPFGQIGFRESFNSPVSVYTPFFKGEEILDYVNKVWYKAVGETAIDWKIIT